MIKRELAFLNLFVFIILSASLGITLSTDMKQTYSPKETIIAKISGNILEPITMSNIEFKRNNVLLALKYGIENLNGSYYIWAIAPEEDGNYSLIINDVATTIAGVQKKTELLQNFSVAGNLTSYSIEPGAILSRENFTIEVNLYEDEQRIISIDFPEEREIALKPGKNKIEFSNELVFGSELLQIKIGNYVVPAYITGSAKKKIERSTGLVFSPQIIAKTLRKGSSSEYDAYLLNKANISIKKISLEYNKSILKIEPDINIELEPRENVSLKIKILKPISEEIDEVIYANSGNFSASLLLSLMIESQRANRTNLTNGEIGTEQLYCEELGGIVCSSNEKCVGTEKDSLQGKCCIGVCKEEEKGSSWIVWLIIGIVLLIVAIIYLKYKRSPKKTGGLEEKSIGKEAP